MIVTLRRSAALAVCLAAGACKKDNAIERVTSEQTVDQPAAAGEPVQLAVTVEKPEVALGDDIVFHFKLTNGGKSPVAVNVPRLDKRSASFRVRRPDGGVATVTRIRAGLSDLMSLPYPDHPSMHEALFDDEWLKGTGVTTLDFAKAMIDEGYHPMTVYFPLVVHGAMLVEPTESESKASLDLFIATLRDLAMATKGNDKSRFTGAPHHAPLRRLDETRAARQPVLKWVKPEPIAEAAE